jgi:hypothetical protein
MNSLKLSLIALAFAVLPASADPGIVVHYEAVHAGRTG